MDKIENLNQMPKSNGEEFYDFEKAVDAHIASANLWHKPLRSVLSNLILIADAAFSGGRFGMGKKADVEKGGTILSRNSYLSHFMMSGSAEIGSDLNDALYALDASDHIDIQSALIYGHFCELVPFVRNGYLNVEKTHDGFRLVHSSQIFAYDEQRDIVASELSLTMLERRAPFNVKALSRMIDGWPHIRGDDLVVVLREAFDFYMAKIIEDEYIEASFYNAAFEFDRDEFLRLRAALMAFASWCIGMAVGAEVKSSEVSSDDEAEHWRKECMEWAAPLLKADFVLGTIQGLSGTSKVQVDKMMVYFTNIPHEGKIISGDGYFAPLTLIGDTYLISPRAMLVMTAERNLLYVANKISRQRFDNLVSQHLESSLLTKAAEIFSSVKGLRIEKNVHWANGEIDLLVCDEVTDTALQMQAKAAIPPQGARMTRQVEQNTLRAVKQLKAVEKLSDEERREILCRAFGVGAGKTRWTSAVLSRSSFGTSSAWSAISYRGALNLFLLRKVVRENRNGESLDLSCVPAAAFRVIAEAIQVSSNGWEERSIDLLDKKIYFPNLHLDNGSLARMIKVEEDSSSAEASPA